MLKSDNCITYCRIQNRKPGRYSFVACTSQLNVLKIRFIFTCKILLLAHKWFCDPAEYKLFSFIIGSSRNRRTSNEIAITHACDLNTQIDRKLIERSPKESVTNFDNQRSASSVASVAPKNFLEFGRSLQLPNF